MTHSQTVMQNRLRMSRGGNYVNINFFNEDGFRKTILETTALQQFHKNLLRMVFILR